VCVVPFGSSKKQHFWMNCLNKTNKFFSFPYYFIKNKIFIIWKWMTNRNIHFLFQKKIEILCLSKTK
jgi:hypothetical protein